MADIAENVPFTDPATAISQGRRHLLVRDYTMAVTALAQACELLAKKHGDTADELGEAYLLYGRALLGLAREETGILGGGVPGSEEAQGEEDAEEDDDEEENEELDEKKLNKIDEKEEEEEEEEEDGDDDDDDDDDDEEKEEDEKKTKTNESVKTITEDTLTKNNEEKDEKNEKIKEEEKDIKKKQADEKEEKTVPKSKSESTSKNNETIDDDDAASGTTSTQQNGSVQENGEQNSEDISKEDEEDEVNNLQVAWEVLELAKLVLLKRGQPGWKLLADSYRLLGEVAMEGGNHKGALNDLQGCLDLLEKINPREPRAIAEIHYQLGLAHSLGNEFDASIDEFNKATKLLESRIKELEAIAEPPKIDDPFYTIEGEIQELKELLPEIQEKITDMQDFKNEACKLVIENLKSGFSSCSSNGAGPSSDTSNSSSSGNTTNPKVVKPVSDISHLVRKKRKADEPETEIPMPPCKKPTPEKAV